jgi:HAD superfamily hydrolase (TIGR01509 family)
MLSAFLIDLDGTIIDSRKPFIITYNRVLVKHSLPPLPPDEGKALRILRMPMEEIFPQLMREEKYRDTAFIESFVEDLKETYGELYLSNVKLCPNSKETIRRLRSLNQKIAVVSSRMAFADYIIPLLKDCGMGDLIDLVVTSKDVAASKPSPEPFLLAAKKLNCEVKECVVVGDSPEDIIAGKAAGMMTVAYTEGFYSLDELSKCDADMVIDDLTKLIHLAQASF